MRSWRQENLNLFLLAVALLLAVTFLWRQAFALDSTHAMEEQEVKPYVFAEMPHGRIYKTVHEGCELYIIESDVEGHSDQWGSQHNYSITAGRGCE